MKKTITKTALAAVLALSAFAAVPSAALADGFYFGFSDGGVQMGPTDDQFQNPNDGPRYDRRRPQRDWEQHGWEQRRWEREGCNQRQAIRQAYRMGLDNPEIVRVTPRRVVVEGEGRRGRLFRVQFANVRGCPAL